MPWLFGKQDKQAKGADEAIRPEPLEIQLDARVFQAMLQEVIEDLGGDSEILGQFAEALRTKQTLFQKGLSQEALNGLTEEQLLTLVETMFTVRRRLPRALKRLGTEQTAAALSSLRFGQDPLGDRMHAFVAVFPEDDRKARRAAWDMAAEALHFTDPEGVPLMTRWVWDPETDSGALRELVFNKDQVQQIPVGNTPGVYEALRHWVAEQLTEAGFYRDLHFTVDLMLAKAYGDYMRSMASGMGMMRGDIANTDDPLELMRKLLGVDPGRPGNQSRIKVDPTH